MRERGSAPLLLAVAVVTVAAGSALLVHRAVMRELAVEGEALLGARAALAADSSLAWFLEAGWRSVPAPGEGDQVIPVPPGVFREEPPLVHDGEVRVRFLGPSARWPGSELWKLTVRGRVMAGGRARAFVQIREAYVTVPREEERGQPIKRAWRIVR